MQNKVVSILTLLIMFFSCEQTQQERIKKIESGEKRPLTVFNEEDVARSAVAVFHKKSPTDYKTERLEDGILVIQKQSQTGEECVKIGGFGVLLRKDNEGQWTDLFKDRRIIYFEQHEKLIVSETFKGDSATYHEFAKSNLHSQ